MKAEKAKSDKAMAEKIKAQKGKMEAAKAQKAKADEEKVEKIKAEKAKADKAMAKKIKAEKDKAAKILGKGKEQQLAALKKQLTHEEQKHFKRKARLDRIKTLAAEEGKTKTVERVDSLIQKEQQRYDRKLKTMTDREQKILQAADGDLADTTPKGKGKADEAKTKGKGDADKAKGKDKAKKADDAGNADDQAEKAKEEAEKTKEEAEKADGE